MKMPYALLGVVYAMTLILAAQTSVHPPDDFKDAEESCLRAAMLLRGENTQGREEALRLLDTLARKGFAPAMHLRGLSFMEGAWGVQKDEQAGFDLIRKSAELEYGPAMVSLSRSYCLAKGTPQDPRTAFEWATKASSFANPEAWGILGSYYEEGFGTDRDISKALSWFEKSAGGGDPLGTYSYAIMLQSGKAVTKDTAAAFSYFKAAALLRYSPAYYCVGTAYLKGAGVARSPIDGLAWMTIASEADIAEARSFMETVPAMPAATLEIVKARIAKIRSEIAAAPQRRDGPEPWSSPRRNPGANLPGRTVKWSGTGFIVSSDGYVVTNDHVAPMGSKVQVVTIFGASSGVVVKSDPSCDLSLIKIEGKFIAIPIAPNARLGSSVATVGFPNTSVQGFSPKLTKGEVSSLAGPKDDPRYYQISVPLQPGNSGGALFDEKGSVVGVVSAKLSARQTLALTGSLPENVNYAIKSSQLLAFLEDVPEARKGFSRPSLDIRKFEDVVQEVERSAVLILTY